MNINLCSPKQMTVTLLSSPAFRVVLAVFGTAALGEEGDDASATGLRRVGRAAREAPCLELGNVAAPHWPVVVLRVRLRRAI